MPPSYLRPLAIAVALMSAVALIGSLLLGDLASEGTDHGVNVGLVGSLTGLPSAVTLYRQTTGHLPASLEDLIRRPPDLPPEEPWQKLVDVMPVDPWGNEYRYIISPSLDHGFGIYSTGADGVTATAGNDPDDCNSWDHSTWVHQDHPHLVFRDDDSLFAAGLACSLSLLAFLFWQARRHRIATGA
jgi:general secretion pathway protein G